MQSCNMSEQQDSSKSVLQTGLRIGPKSLAILYTCIGNVYDMKPRLADEDNAHSSTAGTIFLAGYRYIQTRYGKQTLITRIHKCYNGAERSTVNNAK